MFDKTIERKINHKHEAETTLYALINNELMRCWAFLDTQMKLNSTEATKGNIQAIYKKIEKFHEMIETLVEKSPDMEMHKTVKDLQEHMAERILLTEQTKEESE